MADVISLLIYDLKLNQKKIPRSMKQRDRSRVTVIELSNPKVKCCMCAMQIELDYDPGCSPASSPTPIAYSMLLGSFKIRVSAVCR